MFLGPLPLFWFCLLVLYNYISEGGSFVLLSRITDIARSVRENTPRRAIDHKHKLSLEYKYGKRLFKVIFPRVKPIRWKNAAAYINGEWIDKTGEILYYSGPYRNFHEIPIKPAHINPYYEKLGFFFNENKIIHVKANEIIIRKLRQKIKK